LKRWFLLIALGVLVLPGFAEEPPPYTLIPWPDGAIMWVQPIPEDHTALMTEASRAVESVFAFWNLPVPTPPPDWETPPQDIPEGHLQRSMEEFVNTGGDLRTWFETRPAEVCDPESDTIWTLEALRWGENEISPLILIVFPDRETMNTTVKDYSFSGRFYPYGCCWRNAVEPKCLSGTETVALTPFDFEQTLLHELAHWLFALWCEEIDLDPSAFQPLIYEGFAEYTEASLVRDEDWTLIATAWSTGNDLTTVPFHMAYPLGTRVVSDLVNQRGKEEFLHDLPELVHSWEEEISTLSEDWQTAALVAKLTDGDWAHYRAQLQDLRLCAWMLDPILPTEAQPVLDRLFSGSGTRDDIDLFWQLASMSDPEPSVDIWEKLTRRESTFRHVQTRSDDPDLRMARAHVEVKLRKYRFEEDWENYLHWFIQGVRDVVAYWDILSAEVPQ
jgi:hypothetical protein